MLSRARKFTFQRSRKCDVCCYSQFLSYEVLNFYNLHNLLNLMEKELLEYRAKKAKGYKRSSWSNLKPFFSLSGTSIFRNVVAREPDERVLFWFIAFLKLLFWTLLWGFFIQIEFGTVFFIVSMFYWVYASMQAGTRKPWEPSAYSVFNENCEAIEGTLNAEQFERELKYGAGAVSGN